MEVKVRHLGNVKFEATARGHRVVCDQPPANGGADEGMTPTEQWLLIFHAAGEPLSFVLPSGPWQQVLDSAAALVLPQARWGSGCL